MNRALSLEIPGRPKPYNISYKITEVDVNDAAATLGQTTSKRNRHFVNIEARVRVKLGNVDNSNFSVAQPRSSTASPRSTCQSSERPIARRAAWLVSDTAYKEALIQLNAKLESRRAGGARTSDAEPWSPTKAIVSEEPVLVPALESLEELETRAKALSSAFRDQVHIRDSRVAVTSYLERRWYLTTEGTSVTDRPRGGVVSRERSGERRTDLHDYFCVRPQAKDLKTDKELEGETKKLIDTIAALAKAPVLERYSGPVLFEGEGAVGVLRFTLAPHLGGTPVPEGLSPQDARTFGGALTDKVGLKVTAPTLSIYDDPTAREGCARR